jgi:polysaccharide biosynthesis transport protein
VAARQGFDFPESSASIERITMNTSEAPKGNGSGGFSPAPGPLPAPDPFFIGDRITAKSTRLKSRGVLRRLAGRWSQILMLWLLISAPIILLIHSLVKPTYEAASLLEIESTHTDIFGPLELHTDDSRNLIDLQTQVNLITSKSVLEPALANPLAANLPVIKRAEDPRYDLRKKLKVEIIGGTNLIRIALELPDPNEAVAIVNAVTQAYVVQNVDFGRYANRRMTESYEQQLEKISKEIDSKKRTLKDCNKRRRSVATNPGEMLNPNTETDPTQPTLNKVTQDQFVRLVDKQVQCDLDYLDALAHLEAARTVRERNEDKINELLETRVAEEFKKNSKVATLLERIQEARELSKSKDQAPPPPVHAAREQLEKLTKDYEELWASEFPGLRRRLVNDDQSLLSESRIRELEVAVERKRKKKEGFARQFEKIQVVGIEMEDEDSQTTHLKYQLDSLFHWEDQVRKNLEQLKYEAADERFRVMTREEASASKTPANNRSLEYMAAVPSAVVFLLLGVFLTLEIKAGRKAATLPD